MTSSSSARLTDTDACKALNGRKRCAEGGIAVPTSCPPMTTSAIRMLAIDARLTIVARPTPITAKALTATAPADDRVDAAIGRDRDVEILAAERGLSDHEPGDVGDQGDEERRAGDHDHLRPQEPGATRNRRCGASDHPRRVLRRHRPHTERPEHQRSEQHADQRDGRLGRRRAAPRRSCPSSRGHCCRRRAPPATPTRRSRSPSSSIPNGVSAASSTRHAARLHAVSRRAPA